LNIYTVEEASQVMKIPVETLRKYLRQGKLEGSKAGRKWLISEDNIRDFLKDNSNRKE
jgi:excisionase family DNA binding protein